MSSASTGDRGQVPAHGNQVFHVYRNDSKEPGL